jgi:hypothetical protein
MKFKGQLFFSLGALPDANVTDAIVTNDRIAIDWIEDDVDGHLEAMSRDGVHFRPAFLTMFFRERDSGTRTGRFDG